MTRKSIILAALMSCLLLAAAWFANDHLFEKAHFAAMAGDPAAETAYVYLQGGPAIEVEKEVIGPDLFPALVGDDAFFVIPHQVQTRDVQRLVTAPLTFEQAQAEARTTTQIAGEVIQHLKAEGKTVHVLGFSYGAFVAADVLAEFGNIADTYVLAVGRIDMPDQVWMSFAEGKPMVFADATDPIFADAKDFAMGSGSVVGDQNMMRLAAGLGYHRFSRLLADVDMSNVTFITGTQDDRVGRLTQAERDFLTGRGAEVIVVKAGHEDAIVTPDSLAAIKRRYGVAD